MSNKNIGSREEIAKEFIACHKFFKPIPLLTAYHQLMDGSFGPVRMLPSGAYVVSIPAKESVTETDIDFEFHVPKIGALVKIEVNMREQDRDALVEWLKTANLTDIAYNTGLQGIQRRELLNAFCYMQHALGVKAHDEGN